MHNLRAWRRDSSASPAKCLTVKAAGARIGQGAIAAACGQRPAEGHRDAL